MAKRSTLMQPTESYAIFRPFRCLASPSILLLRSIYPLVFQATGSSFALVAAAFLCLRLIETN